MSYIFRMIVFDSSTLILLARTDLLDVFLADHRHRVTIPRGVETECVESRSCPDAVLIAERIRERRILVQRVRSSATVSRLMKDFHLGHGEAEALTLALEKKARIVATDDRNAIRACKLLRLRFTTAIGILLRSTEKGLITETEARRRLERLAACGRYHREIVEDARQRLGGESDGKGAKGTKHPNGR